MCTMVFIYWMCIKLSRYWISTEVFEYLMEILWCQVPAEAPAAEAPPAEAPPAEAPAS